MRHRPSTRVMVFAVSAGAVAIVASLIVAGAANDGRGHRSSRGGVSQRVARVVSRPTARPTRPRPRLAVPTARATRVARRFAASWRAWDTGQGSPHDAAALQRLSVAGLWQRLRHQRARPTAARPPASLALRSVRAIASGREIWRAPLVARHPESSYLGTLVIVAAAAGPRVAAIER
jgi:hypothetical protein